jgi:hypothetical protein
MNLKLTLIASAFAIATVAAASSASAASCIGVCGNLGPDGVVTSPPAGGPGYGYVTTSGGIDGAGQTPLGGGVNGSEFRTDTFSAKAGDDLQFYFNYVTSDGAEFADYSFAELLTSTSTHVAWLFTARTTPSGDTSPGFGLETNDSTLTPLTSPIIGGGPDWSPLGDDSGSCFDEGCGYTGWIRSDYTVADAGDYILRLGVTNALDHAYDSGLAYAGANIGGVVIPTSSGAPEAATWAMMLMGFFGLGAMLRGRKPVAA